MSGYENPMDGTVSSSENRTFMCLCDVNIFKGTVLSPAQICDGFKSELVYCQPCY